MMPAQPGIEIPMNFIAITTKIINMLDIERKNPSTNENFRGISVNDIRVLSK